MIGVIVQILVTPPLAIVFSSMIINPLFSSLVLMLNIMKLLTLFLKHVGFEFQNVLLEHHCPVTKATLVYRDNVSAVYLSNNLVHYQRRKHIEMDIHFVSWKILVWWGPCTPCSSRLQLPDIFTKGLLRFFLMIFELVSASVNFLIRLRGVIK